MSVSLNDEGQSQAFLLLNRNLNPNLSLPEYQQPNSTSLPLNSEIYVFLNDEGQSQASSFSTSNLNPLPI